MTNEKLSGFFPRLEGAAARIGRPPKSVRRGEMVVWEDGQKVIKIPLLHEGEFTIVDVEDYPVISGFNWSFNPKGYVCRHRVVGDVGSVTKFMHRIINKTPQDMFTDHVNGIRWDNRRSNLRSATQLQNARNCKKPITNTSGFKGAYWHKRDEKFHSAIHFNGRLIHLGNFPTAELAHTAYCEASKIYHGEFSRTT